MRAATNVLLILSLRGFCSSFSFLEPLARSRIRLASKEWVVGRSAGSDDAQEGATGSFLDAVPAEWQGQVLQRLKSVIDPDLGSDIVTLGFVQNLKLDDDSRTVSFDVQLTTPACPVKDQFAADCYRLVSGLPWVDAVEVQMTAQAPTSDNDLSGLKSVGAIVAVSSCKGGVGKSTTAVNLAYSLQRLGANVGILDVDVYGPSLPTMVKPEDDVVRFVGRQIAPLQRNGVKLMSFGYVNEGTATMRGPMVTQLLDQFLGVINWGPLDYLILDFPPGTGDIPLTLTQRLNITSAVIVTTPQELSFADVVRGVEMFDSVQVPIAAVVENMAYYEAKPSVDLEKLTREIRRKLQASLGLNGDASSSKAVKDLDSLTADLVETVKGSLPTERIRIFGPGHKERLSNQWGIEHTFSVPLLDRIAANGDSGTPYVLEFPDSPPARVFLELAQSVVSEVAKAKYSNSRPDIGYDKAEHQIRVRGISSDANEGREAGILEDGVSVLTPAELRRACRCAGCVEELTGRQILIPTSVPESVQPMRMSPTGNYALSVDWSDGHRSLYPYRQVKALLHEKRRRQLQQEQEATTRIAPEPQHALA
jgi:Mrp family chromosome partitioning ATPase/DUF971 family protein